MRIIILEGIATSGKTSVKNKLAELLTGKGISFSVIREEETLMPILDNTDRQASVDFLKKIIGKALERKKDVIIFDRLFFTHLFKTNSSPEDLREIEDMIRDEALLAFLKIKESKIPERIALARRHRVKEWNEYVSQKGSDEEVNRYYTNQQRVLLDLLKKTSLNYKVYDTTDMDFKKIAKSIFKMLESNPI